MAASSLVTRTVHPVGTRVVVRDRFVGGWNRGFEVAGHAPEGYRIRRLSDGSVFPDVFAHHEVQA